MLLINTLAVLPPTQTKNCTTETFCLSNRVQIACSNESCAASFILNNINNASGNLPAAFCKGLKWNASVVMDFSVSGFCAETVISASSRRFDISFDGSGWNFRYLVDVATTSLSVPTGGAQDNSVMFLLPPDPTIQRFCQIIAQDKFSAAFAGHGGCVPYAKSYV